MLVLKASDYLATSSYWDQCSGFQRERVEREVYLVLPYAPKTRLRGRGVQYNKSLKVP